MSKLRSFSKILAATALGLSLIPAAFAGAPTPQVTESTARATALAAVPSGAVQSSELETESGRQIWSFDIQDPKSSDVVEVQVDARTRLVVSKKRETRADQKREAQADQKATR